MRSFPTRRHRRATRGQGRKPKQTQYDFYTLLPGNEVAMSDAELAETGAPRKRRASRQRRPRPPRTRMPPRRATPVAATRRRRTPAATPSAPATPQRRATTPDRQDNERRYLLQAGAFGQSGDAEATKAKSRCWA